MYQCDGIRQKNAFIKMCVNHPLRNGPCLSRQTQEKNGSFIFHSFTEFKGCAGKDVLA